MILKKSILREGRVKAVGHKHTAVPLISSAISLKKICLSNLPDISDTKILLEILIKSGAFVQYEDDKCYIDTSNISKIDLPAELTSQVHGSLYLICPTLARFGHVTFNGRSGGCMIGDPAKGGDRPTSHIIDVLENFGVKFKNRPNEIIGSCSEFNSCDIDIMKFSESKNVLTGPLVSGATKTAILASMTASGTSRIYHPYPKPDAMELLHFACLNGCEVKRMEHFVEITPTNLPLDEVTPFRILSDLSQIMTFICASVWFKVPIFIEFPDAAKVIEGLHQEILILEKMGVQLRWTEHGLACVPPEKLRSVDINVTSIGIYSDHQPFFALMFLQGDRPARITERVWKNRFSYASALRQLGGRLELDKASDSLTVYPSELKSRKQETLRADDLRSAVVLLFAGLSVEHDMHLIGTEHLERGYENLIDNIVELGAQVIDFSKNQ